MDHSSELKELRELAHRHAAGIRQVADFIYTHPEVAYEEFQASAAIADFLEAEGIQVERCVCGLKTALRAWVVNEPAPWTPAVCVPAEYDALRGLGHGCGHNLIAACSLAAVIAARDFAVKYRIPLRLCFMGTPAEESNCGKGELLSRGAFDGIEMAVMAHPDCRLALDEGALGVARGKIIFHGKAAHAGSAPELGINALDAMVIFYADMMKWRRMIASNERVHGIVTNGGVAPNIIPDVTEAFFYVRAATVEGVRRLKAQLEASAQSGAQATGCTAEVKWISSSEPIKFNRALSRHLKECLHEENIDVPMTTGTEDKSSTDMGNVTQRMPGAQFRFSIFPIGERCSLHTIRFREAAGSDLGFHNAIDMGAVLAKVLLDYTRDDDFRQRVQADFRD